MQFIGYVLVLLSHDIVLCVQFIGYVLVLLSHDIVLCSL